MSWTSPPRTFVTNEVLTSPIFNTHLRDQLLALGHPYAAELSQLDRTNSVAEQSIFATPPTLTGGDLGANGWALIRAAGDGLHNNAATSITWRLKLGATTICGDAVTPAANATRFAWQLECLIHNIASQAVQRARVLLITTRLGETASVAGTGALALDGTAVVNGGLLIGNAVEDTSSNKVLDFTVQYAVATTLVSWRREWVDVLLAQG